MFIVGMMQIIVVPFVCGLEDTLFLDEMICAVALLLLPISRCCTHIATLETKMCVDLKHTQTSSQHDFCMDIFLCLWNAQLHTDQ